MVNDQSIINKFLEKSFSFSSLFILSKEGCNERIVAEIKNLNDGLGQVSFVPLGEEEFPFQEGESIEFSNESGNFHFHALLLKSHGSKWITVRFPTSIRMINLRQFGRIEVPKNSSKLLINPSITSYGEDGQKKRASFKAELLDISATGVSLKLKSRRLDGLFRSDIVEMSLSEKYSFLAKIRGKVIHKSIAHASDKEIRFYKVGVEFQEAQDISTLNFD